MSAAPAPDSRRRPLWLLEAPKAAPKGDERRQGGIGRDMIQVLEGTNWRLGQRIRPDEWVPDERGERGSHSVKAIGLNHAAVLCAGVASALLQGMNIFGTGVSGISINCKTMPKSKQQTEVPERARGAERSKALRPVEMADSLEFDRRTEPLRCNFPKVGGG